MAYIGQQPVVGRYILLDQISGGFDGSASGFTMSTAGGAQGVKPGLAQNVLLSLGGVIQQPGVDYTISGSGITFTTPPVSGTTFFATVLGDAQSVGTPSDGTVTPASIASGFDFGFPNVNVTGVTTIASGSAAVPSLTITGDTDTGLFSPGANQIAVTTEGSTAVTVSGSRVGIGTTATQQILTIDVNDSGTTQASFNGINIANTDTTTNNGSAIIFGQTVPGNSNARIGVINTDRTGSSEDQEIFFGSLGGGSYSERMRIDSSGRLLIGTDTSINTGNSPSLEIVATGTAVLSLGRDDSTISAGNVLGSVKFFGNDGGSYQQCAEIAATADGDHANDDKPTRLEFYTTADGASSPTERMRISNAGNITHTYSDSSTSTSTQIPPGLRINNQDNTLGRLAGINFAHGGAGTANAGIFHVTTDTTTTSTACLGDLAFYMKADGVSTMTERMRLDSAGRLLIGTDTNLSSSANRFLQVSDSAPFVIFHSNTNNPTADNTLAGLEYGGQAGGSYVAGAFIRAQTDADWASGSAPTRLVFSTTASSASSPTERLRIDREGNSIFGSAGTLNSQDTVGIIPSEGRISFGMDGRSSLVTGEAACYIFSGSGASGSYPAGTLVLQSRSNVGRSIVLATGDTPSDRLTVNSAGVVLIGTSSASGDSLLQVDGPIETGVVRMASHSRSYTASTSATDVFNVRFTSGHGSAEFTWFFNDNSSPNGARAGKVYIAFRGSGANISSVGISSSTEVSRTSGSVTNIAWSASVADTSNITLTVTGDQTSGGGTLFIYGVSPYFDGLTPISDA